MRTSTQLKVRSFLSVSHNLRVGCWRTGVGLLGLNSYTVSLRDENKSSARQINKHLRQSELDGSDASDKCAALDPVIFTRLSRYSVEVVRWLKNLMHCGVCVARATKFNICASSQVPFQGRTVLRKVIPAQTVARFGLFSHRLRSREIAGLNY